MLVTLARIYSSPRSKSGLNKIRIPLRKRRPGSDLIETTAKVKTRWCEELVCDGCGSKRKAADIKKATEVCRKHR